MTAYAYRRLLRVSWTTNRTNTSVLQEIKRQERLLATVQRRVSFSILVMWSEPEICAPKYWKVELMGRKDEAGQCEDGQMISDQWQCSRLAKDRQQWRPLVHEMISDPQQ